MLRQGDTRVRAQVMGIEGTICLMDDPIGNFCTKCGVPVPGDNKFCSGCGIASGIAFVLGGFLQGPKITLSQSVPSTISPANPILGNRLMRRNVIVGAVVVAAVVAAAVVMAIAWPSGESNESNFASRPTTVADSSRPTIVPDLSADSVIFLSEIRPLIDELRIANREFRTLVRSFSEFNAVDLLPEVQDYGVRFRLIGEEIGAIDAPAGWSGIKGGSIALSNELASLTAHNEAYLSFLSEYDVPKASFTYGLIQDIQEHIVDRFIWISRQIDAKTP